MATEPQSDQAQQASAGPGLLGQLIRFGVIGGFCALLDLGTYSLLRVVVGMDGAPWADLARAISFIVGTTTAFFLNRRFTFAEGKRDGNAQIGSFVLLYAVTFFVTVAVNRLMLNVLPEMAWKATLAWVVSQGTATVINFVMLKWVVFRVRPVKEN